MGKVKKRFKPTFKEEKKLWKQGYRFVVGLDEVGRGPLAGPVVAGAVCVQINPKLKSGNPKQNQKPKFQISELRDSKQLTAKARDKWYEVLINHPQIKWGIGVVPPKEIDKLNIFQATKKAMRLALKDLKLRPEFLLMDGSFLLDGVLVNQRAIPKGDEKVFSCAAASVIAKVTRDRMMVEYHQKYPQYGFDTHKGYGCKMHYEAIQKHGVCAIHRMSFGPCKRAKNLL